MKKLLMLLAVVGLVGCGKEQQRTFNQQFDKTMADISQIKLNSEDCALYQTSSDRARDDLNYLWKDIDWGANAAAYQEKKYREAEHELSNSYWMRWDWAIGRQDEIIRLEEQGIKVVAK